MQKNITIHLFVLINLNLLLSTNVVGQNIDSVIISSNKSNDIKNSMRTEDLLATKDILAKERIKLQKLFEIPNSEKSVDNIYKQTIILEEAIVGFVEMKHKVITSDFSNQRINVDSQLLLARLIYIKAKTWYMQESLEQRIGELHLDSVNSTTETNNEVRDVILLTNSVIENLENAKRFDRLKFRYNRKIVVSNWEHTADKLKRYSSSLEEKDSEYEKRYRNMLSDLYLMIGVLDLF